MNYSTADIRQFLMEAFSDEELNAFCFDNFRDVYDNFTAGQTKGQRVQALIEHCQHHETLSNLAVALQRARPGQFSKRFPGEIIPPTENERKAAPVPAVSATFENQSGGVDITADEANIAGDVTGRDKITVNVAPGSTIVLGGTSKPPLASAANYSRDIERRLPAPPVLAQRRATATTALCKRRLPLIPAVVALIGPLLCCITAWLVVPEFRQLLGLDRSTPTSVAVNPTHTPTSTPRPTLTLTPTSTPTITPTPDPCVCRRSTDEESLKCLITAESEAANRSDLNLIARIFASDAIVVKGNVSPPVEVSARAYYQEAFAKTDYISARHFDETIISVGARLAYATSGSAGYFTNPDGSSVPYTNPPPSDQWTFGKNALGCWVITRFAFNMKDVPFP
jgi:ketosteroid isomerase-like protein